MFCNCYDCLFFELQCLVLLINCFPLQFLLRALCKQFWWNWYAVVVAICFLYGAIYTSKKFQAELEVSVAFRLGFFSIFFWLSWDECESCSAQVGSRAEHGSHFTVYHLLFGTQSTELNTGSFLWWCCSIKCGLPFFSISLDFSSPPKFFYRNNLLLLNNIIPLRWILSTGWWPLGWLHLEQITHIPLRRHFSDMTS